MPTPEEIAAAKKKAADKKAADEAARKKAAKESQDDDLDDDDEVDDEDVDDEDTDDDGDDDDDSDLDDPELKLSEKQKAHFKKLRQENAKHRVEAKNLKNRFEKLESGLKSLFGEGEDDKLTPEQKLEKLRNEKEQSEFNRTLTEAAIEHGVGKANLKYFKFLVAQAAEDLGEGEELDDAALKKFAKEANGRTAGKGTSVEGKDDPAPDGEDGEIALEEFQAMGIGARSALYQKDKATYEKLLLKERAAKKKK